MIRTMTETAIGMMFMDMILPKTDLSAMAQSTTTMPMELTVQALSAQLLIMGMGLPELPLLQAKFPSWI